MIYYQLFLRNDNAGLNTRGSNVAFQSIDCVTYQNDYLSPGQTLATWSTMDAFWSMNSQNFLPRLHQNKSYYLQNSYCSQPEKRLYVKITFYNRYKERVSQMMLKDVMNRFEVPEETIHYTVELINGGLKNFEFHQITLFPIEQSEAPFYFKEDDLYISELIHLDEEIDELNVVFNEPRLASVHGIQWQHFPQVKNVIEIMNTSALAHFYLRDEQIDHRIIKVIRELIDNYQMSKISFIGYGKISNFAARIYASSFNDFPINVYQSTEEGTHYPNVYRQIQGYDKMMQIAQEFNGTIIEYGRNIKSDWLPDVNTETVLRDCPKWK